MLKERHTDTHVYFVGGIFSQWWSSSFEATVWPSLESRTWVNCEQFMMAGKAALFHDFDSYINITRTDNPKDIKALGRKVCNFDDTIWRLNACNIVQRGNLAKFSQNDILRNHLLNTQDKHLVEGAWYDRVWGVGLSWDDPLIDNSDNWRGTNWLGETLMIVREQLA